MIKPGRGESLSKIMQWILSVFAVQFNKRFGWNGHVWYDRFKSRIVDGLNEYLHVFRYIAENPLRAGIARYPWDYIYNGVTHLRRLDYRIVEKPTPVLKMLEPTLCSPFLLS